MQSERCISLRRWVIVNAVIVTAMINLAVNASIAWLSTRGQSRVPLWSAPVAGGPSTIGDTLATTFLLPFTTCIRLTAAIRRDIRRGILRQANLEQRPGRTALPNSVLHRALILGAVSLAAIGPIAAAMLAGLGLGPLRDGEFLLYKTSFAVALGLAVTPVIAVLTVKHETRGSAVPTDDHSRAHYSDIRQVGEAPKLAGRRD